MAMQLAKLAEVFKSPPVPTEIEAIDYITTKWVEFFSDASTFGVTANPAALEPAKGAMASALVGISVPNAGAAKLTSGISAFWGVVIASAPVVWVTAPPLALAVPPGGIGGIAAALAPTFASNMAGSKSLEDSANAVASAILSTQLGGTATNTLAPTPITMPIL